MNTDHTGTIRSYAIAALRTMLTAERFIASGADVSGYYEHVTELTNLKAWAYCELLHAIDGRSESEHYVEAYTKAHALEEERLRTQ